MKARLKTQKNSLVFFIAGERNIPVLIKHCFEHLKPLKWTSRKGNTFILNNLSTNFISHPRIGLVKSFNFFHNQLFGIQFNLIDIWSGLSKRMEALDQRHEEMTSKYNYFLT